MPMVINAFTAGHEDSSQHWGWSVLHNCTAVYSQCCRAFLLFAGMYGLGTLVFVSLASGKVKIECFVSLPCSSHTSLACPPVCLCPTAKYMLVCL